MALKILRSLVSHLSSESPTSLTQLLSYPLTYFQHDHPVGNTLIDLGDVKGEKVDTSNQSSPLPFTPLHQVYSIKPSLTRPTYISYVPVQPRPVLPLLLSELTTVGIAESVRILTLHPCDLIADEAAGLMIFLAK